MLADLIVRELGVIPAFRVETRIENHPLSPPFTIFIHDCDTKFVEVIFSYLYIIYLDFYLR
jgi:hypothetical protein